MNPKVSRRKEIFKTRAEINAKETKDTIAKINKIRNENGEITADNTEIQRIIRDYYQQLYANKMDNVEEMEKFLAKYNFPKLSQEEIENLNRPITSKEIEAVIRADRKSTRLNSSHRCTSRMPSSA